MANAARTTGSSIGVHLGRPKLVLVFISGVRVDTCKIFLPEIIRCIPLSTLFFESRYARWGIASVEGFG